MKGNSFSAIIYSNKGHTFNRCRSEYFQRKNRQKKKEMSDLIMCDFTRKYAYIYSPFSRFSYFH